MFVNYVREINAFHRYANVNFLGSSERLLWFGLMDYINLHYASGSEWPGDFISIPNKGILSHVPFGEDALTEARSRLKQRGLIEYLPGKKNKEAPKYRIHYFSMELSTGYQQNVGTDYPEKTGNMPGNIPGNMPGNIPGNIPGNVPGSHPYINLNVTPRNPKPNVTPDDEEEEAEERAREEAVAVIDSAFRESYGRSATIAEANILALRYCRSGMTEPEVLREAVREAAQHGAKNPAIYARRILSDWDGDYIRTVQDLNEWQVLKTMYHGDDCFPAGSATYGDLEAARERRRRAAEEEKEKVKQG
ncbi:MAG: DnaD domain protein [Clostridiales bacterium]|nr:DnaD domain protein [Clostridiales bacterium]